MGNETMVNNQPPLFQATKPLHSTSTQKESSANGSNVQNRMEPADLSLLLRVDAVLKKSTLQRYFPQVVEENGYLVIGLSYLYKILERTGMVVPSVIEISSNNNTLSSFNASRTFDSKEQIILSLLRLGAEKKLYRLRLRSLSLSLAKDANEERVFFEVLNQTTTGLTRMEQLKQQWKEYNHQNTVGSGTNYFNMSSIQHNKNMDLIKYHQQQVIQRIAQKSKTINEDKSSHQATEKKLLISNIECNNNVSQSFGSEKYARKKRPLHEPHIHSDMTLRERVRARAEYSQRIMNNSVNASKTETSFTVETSMGALQTKQNKLSMSQAVITSNTTLLRLADALRSYTRRKESRFSAFSTQKSSSSPFSKTTNSSFNISFRELVTHLNGAIYDGSFGSLPKQRASKKIVITCLQKLVETVPQWLTIMKNTTTGKIMDSVLKIRKDIDYHSCVTLVLGGRVCKRKKAITSLLKRKAANAMEDDCDSKKNTKESRILSCQDEDKKKSPGAFLKPSSRTSLSTSLTSTSIPKTENNDTNVSRKFDIPIPHFKAADCLISDLEEAAPDAWDPLKRDTVFGNIENRSNLTKNNDSGKRKLNSGPQCQPNQACHPTKKKMKLSRVNKNLVFCDADARGNGSNMSIAPTYKNGVNTSSRGLQNLFSRLNAGQRI